VATTFQNIDGVIESPKWIINGLDSVAIRYAENFGGELSGKQGISSYNGFSEALSTSQIRNVFGEVKKMQMKGFNETEFLLLKPRLAYACERKGTKGSKEFRKVIDKAIDAVMQGRDTDEKKQRFENFAAFFEAILAYHRSFGGKTT